ncbi:MAG: metalloregulator ArsR/SmtB family transcription factor [Hyphomicrobiaceae bacterium]|nr:metalloregulator ArsR/SmtB family transcription factor [Hyphomicrobiaceae bacterium]
MEAATTLFSTLADPIRLRCLALISAEGELCVCELVAALDMPQPKVSRHLAILRDAGLLKDRRAAQWVLYALAPELPSWSRAAIAAAVEAVRSERQYAHDLKRLHRAERPLQERAGRMCAGGRC